MPLPVGLGADIEPNMAIIGEFKGRILFGGAKDRFDIEGQPDAAQAPLGLGRLASLREAAKIGLFRDP